MHRRRGVGEGEITEGQGGPQWVLSAGWEGGLVEWWGGLWEGGLRGGVGFGFWGCPVLRDSQGRFWELGWLTAWF